MCCASHQVNMTKTVKPRIKVGLQARGIAFDAEAFAMTFFVVCNAFKTQEMHACDTLLKPCSRSSAMSKGCCYAPQRNQLVNSQCLRGLTNFSSAITRSCSYCCNSGPLQALTQWQKHPLQHTPRISSACSGLLVYRGDCPLRRAPCVAPSQVLLREDPHRAVYIPSGCYAR